MHEGDKGRWLTYAEAGWRLGISAAAARMYARQLGWPRRTPNAAAIERAFWCGLTLMISRERLRMPNIRHT